MFQHLISLWTQTKGAWYFIGMQIYIIHIHRYHLTTPPTSVISNVWSLHSPNQRVTWHMSVPDVLSFNTTVVSRLVGFMSTESHCLLWCSCDTSFWPMYQRLLTNIIHTHTDEALPASLQNTGYGKESKVGDDYFAVVVKHIFRLHVFV